MVFPRPIEAVVFDMDGLLIDSEGLVRAALIQAAANLGFEMPIALCASMIGLPDADGVRKIIEHFGPDFPLDRYRAEERRQIDLLLAEGIALKAGVLEILDHLDRRSIPRAVATSSSRRSAREHLTHNGVHGRFTAIVAREDVERHKPNPDPFLKAAALLGVAPEHCLALEDSHNGVRAAHAAGMMTVMVPDLLEPTDEMHAKCVAIAESLHHVIALIDQTSARGRPGPAR
jgi:HAD superfamily hydrolase (TIGR01509 family)